MRHKFRPCYGASYKKETISEGMVLKRSFEYQIEYRKPWQNRPHSGVSEEVQ